MPFDFGAIADFAADAFSNVDFGDLGSIVDDLGGEFLSGDAFSFTDFDIPLGDVAGLGGWTEVGSFAGSADWFDTFNVGSILDSIPSIGDFNLGSLTDSLPSLSSIRDVATTFSNDIGGIVKTAQTAVKAYQKVAPLVNVGFSALGVQNPLTPITQVVQQTIGVAGAAAGIAGAAGGITSLSSLASNPTAIATVASVTGVPPNLISSGARAVDQYGLGILTDQESTQLTKKATLINSFVDAELPSIKTYNQAIASQADLESNLAEIKKSIAGNDRVISDATKNIEEITQNLQDPDLSDAQRARLEEQINANQTSLAEATANNAQNQESLNSISGLVTNNQQIITQTNASVNNGPQGVESGAASQFTSAYDPETGQWSVFDNISGTTVRTGLTQQAAILAEEDLNITSGLTLNTSSTTTTTSDDPFEQARLAAIAESENVRAPTEADVLAAINGQTSALVTQARAQQTVRELRNNKAQSSDWRVRLRLAPNSNYLYNDPSPSGPGILQPLKATDGVIFPYTPSIETAYKANYDPYDLTHSNHRGYFYKGSYVDAVNVRGTFTAQDSKEADYLLAVIHFFRSCTKMFYGNDQQRGSPPPLVYLNGYGDYQFSEHPCVVSQFNYTLPPDVDYIRAQSNLTNNTNRLNSRLRNPIANNPLAYSVNRLLNSSLVAGALDFRPTLPGSGNLANSSPTYVPTKMEISITLFPMQSRSQISNNFSVKEFANGNLLKGGYW